MEANTNSLIEFKKKAAAVFLGDEDHNPMILVAVKYTGDISVLYSNDPDMVKVIPLMTAERNPYYVWRQFSVQKEARDYESQLRSLEISHLIPMDPMKVKAAR